VSDGRYELTVRNGRNSGFNLAGVADSKCRVTRQIDPGRQKLNQRDCTPLLDHPNRILALLR